MFNYYRTLAGQYLKTIWSDDYYIMDDFGNLVKIETTTSPFKSLYDF